MSRELSQELPSSVSAPRPLALAVRQPIDCVATSGQLSTLDDGVCLIILRFLNQNDLCLSINVSHRFRDLGCSDIVWKRLCQLRWAHMQNMPKVDLGTWELPLFWRADYTGIELTLSEEASIEKREQNLAALGAVKIPLPILPLMLGKFKTSFAYGEMDKFRQAIQLDEVSFFRWQLVYNGQPSTTGLRHFQEGGVYNSPYMGASAWQLGIGGSMFNMAGMDLHVMRRSEDWGWTIGAGAMTEYRSVEIARGQHCGTCSSPGP
jgi:hypothetical protein